MVSGVMIHLGPHLQDGMSEELVEGRARVVKMSMLLDDLVTSSKLKKRATPIPTQTTFALRRTIDRLLHKHRWPRDQAAQVEWVRGGCWYTQGRAERHEGVHCRCWPA
jgi:hypothetical protein